MHREENMKLKLAVIGLAAFGSAALSAGGASAMPNGLPATADTMKNVEHVPLGLQSLGTVLVASELL